MRLYIHRWTKGVDLFNNRLLIFPVHLRTHWCLATVELSTRQISYYDSLKNENLTCLKTLREYLVKASEDTKLYSTEWHFIYRTDIPEQHNSSDCGIFMCMYARCLAKRCPLNFNQDDIPNINGC